MKNNDVGSLHIICHIHTLIYSTTPCNFIFILYEFASFFKQKKTILNMDKKKYSFLHGKCQRIRELNVKENIRKQKQTVPRMILASKLRG